MNSNAVLAYGSAAEYLLCMAEGPVFIPSAIRNIPVLLCRHENRDLKRSEV